MVPNPLLTVIPWSIDNCLWQYQIAFVPRLSLAVSDSIRAQTLFERKFSATFLSTLGKPRSQASPVFVFRFAFSIIHGRARKTGKAWEHLSRE